MSRAQAHLAAGRYAEAAGGFRAVLWIDPTVVAAHVGLARAQAGRGRHDEAVAGLVAAAEVCAERRRPTDALSLYATALAMAPARIELHVDIAVLERSMGREEAATARIEALAERYFDTGRTDKAAEVLRFMSRWDTEDTSTPEPVAAEPSASGVPTELPAATTETVVCATILVRPDGTLMRVDANTRPPAAPPEVPDEPTLRRRPPRPPGQRRAATPPPIAKSGPKAGARPPAPPSRRATPSRPIAVALPATPSRPIAVARPATPARAGVPTPGPRRDISSGAITRRPPVRAGRPRTENSVRTVAPAKSSALADRLRKRATIDNGPKRRARPVEPRVRRPYAQGETPIDEDAITLCFRRSDLIKTRRA